MKTHKRSQDHRIQKPNSNYDKINHSLCAADFDRDGDIDLAFTNEKAATIGIRQGVGKGSVNGIIVF
jgi:hypothetical protein